MTPGMAPGMTPNTPARPAPLTAKVQFAAPADWKRVPPATAFTLAEWELPDGGHCSITQVGGGVQANLQRWAGQFQPGGDTLETEELSGSTYPTTLAVIHGTFTATRSIGGGPPREGWMLVGAGVEQTPQLGDLYVKAVGPASVLEPELPELRRSLAALEVVPLETGNAPSGGGDPSGAAPSSPHVSFEAPADWTPTTPRNGFTLAQWTIPGGGVCTITLVGGGVQPNLARWASQFQVASGDSLSELQSEELEGTEYPTTMATIQGTFLSTRVLGGGPPRENWMLVGAGIENTPLGRGEVYVKAVGPADQLSAQVQDIRRACSRIRFSE